MTGARRKKIIKVLSGHGDIHYRKLSNPTRIYVDHLDNSGLIGNRMRNRDMRTLVDAVLRSAVKHKVHSIQAYPANSKVRRLMQNLGGKKLS